jgi:hypothetical protein
MLIEYPQAGSLYVTQPTGAGLAVGAATGVGLIDGAEAAADLGVDGDPQAPTSNSRTNAEVNRNVNMTMSPGVSSAAPRDLSSWPSSDRTPTFQEGYCCGGITRVWRRGSGTISTCCQRQDVSNRSSSEPFELPLAAGLEFEVAGRGPLEWQNCELAPE